jgi:putative ABC transport system substrate-binding protein
VDSERLVVAFEQGLKEGGYLEQQNVAVEFRWGEGHADRLPALAADLVRRRVAVIVAAGTEALVVAKAATSTIPIVFALGEDPVRLGFVESFNKPGGNITGISFETADLLAKRAEILRELLPRAGAFAYLTNPNSVGSAAEAQQVESAGRVLGQQIFIVRAASEADFEAAFRTLAARRINALIVASGAFFFDRRDRLTALAASHAIPTIYDLRDYARAGGLLSYGPSITDVYRQVGAYVSKILSGANPADLPVIEPSLIELVININSARALGLVIPPALLTRADDLIK